MILQIKPYIIAGPCSAESEEQIMTCAKALSSDKRVSVFRAGIWKPRTRPGSYEGIGNKGLKWLQQVKLETGVFKNSHGSRHDKACQRGTQTRYRCAVWIGARTSGNPFSMQEIAEALTGVDITVFIKNPVNPDLELWIGAVERIRKAGIKKRRHHPQRIFKL